MNRNRRKTETRTEIQTRAEELKELSEQRAELLQRLKEMTDKVEMEKRAFSTEEDTEFADIEKQVGDIDSTIEKMERARSIPEKKKKEKEKGNTEDGLQERAFAAYIRGEVLNERADANLTMGENGAVVPTTIAQKIIKKVYDTCPIYQLANKYNVKGNIQIPYYDDENQKITMSYATEFNELESSNGKFGTIELKGFLAGVLSKISKSLINNSQFDIVPFVVNEMAAVISRWIENEFLNGTEDKIEGLSKNENIITTASTSVITADELIELQEEVPDTYQGNAVWIMNKKTRTSIRKLKDGDGNYILNKDATTKWGYTLFGKDVYTSENMAKIEAGKTAIYYGDMTGLAVKLSEEMNIEVLREKYATQHAVGVVGWIELDSKIENKQKIAGLKMKAE